MRQQGVDAMLAGGGIHIEVTPKKCLYGDKRNHSVQAAQDCVNGRIVGSNVDQVRLFSVQLAAAHMPVADEGSIFQSVRALMSRPRW